MFNILIVVLALVVELLTYILYRYFEERIFRQDHYRKWRAWKKNNTNSPIHKLFVLFGWSHSPSLEVYDVIRSYESTLYQKGYLATTYYKDTRKK